MVFTFKYAVFAVLAVFSLPKIAKGGSMCPPRQSIYPCLCTNLPLAKKQTFTDISCRHIGHIDSLSSIFPQLQTLDIDRFIIYDSFWGENDHTKKRLPNNWFSLLKIKELQILDSEISHDIACDELMIGCPNHISTTLSIINSSSTDHFITFCEQRKLNFSWISCMSKLKHFNFIQNNLKTINSKFFERPMNDILTLNFSRNEINRIETGAFRNLPKLTSLDLSHNMIPTIRINMFEGNIKRELPLKYLDLSFNFLKQLSPDILKLSPQLRYFSAANNRIEKLPFEEWKHLSKEIRTINLIGNPLLCDCHIIWINCTLKTHVNIAGTCLKEEYAETSLRRVSKFMSERCVNGIIEIRDRTDKTTKRNACINWDNSHNNIITTPIPTTPQRSSRGRNRY